MSVTRLPPLPPERPWGAVLFMLAAPQDGPCVTLENIIAVYGPNYRVPIGSIPQFPPGAPPYPANIPYSIEYSVNAEETAGVAFIQLASCARLIQLVGRR